MKPNPQFAANLITFPEKILTFHPQGENPV